MLVPWLYQVLLPFVADGRVHKFCGITHARQAGAVPLPTKCALISCDRPCYKDADGRTHDFCGITHAREVGAVPPAHVTAKSWKDMSPAAALAHPFLADLHALNAEPEAPRFDFSFERERTAGSEPSPRDPAGSEPQVK